MPSYANTVYIDPTAGSDGSGSFGSPRNVWPTLADNTLYRIKRGGTLTRTNAQFDIVGRNIIGFEPYGDEADPAPRLFGDYDPGVDAYHTVSIDSTECTIRGLTIERSVPSGSFGRAALTIYGTGVLIENCDLIGGYNGVRILNNGQRIVIQRNRIHGQREDGIWMRAGPGTMILDNDIYDWNNGSTAGDGIQTSEDTGSIVIAYNRLTIPASTVKMGILAQSLTNTGAQYLLIRNVVRSLSLSGGTLGPHILIEGSGLALGNYCIGPMFRGVAIETKFAGQMARAIGNTCIATQETNESAVYGVLLGGVNQDKTVECWNNTLIGLFERPIYLTTWTAGTTYSGGNNHVDAKGRSAVTGYRNDTGRSLTVYNDNIVGCPGGNSNTGMTHTGVTAITSHGLDDLGMPAAGSALLGVGSSLAPYFHDLQGLYSYPPNVGARGRVVRTLR